MTLTQERFTRLPDSEEGAEHAHWQPALGEISPRACIDAVDAAGSLGVQLSLNDTYSSAIMLMDTLLKMND